jgi:hypothetical protein
MQEPVHVRLMSDYLCGFPVWDNNSGGNISSPRGLGLSVGLVNELRAWQAFFDEHFDWNAGWDSEERSRAYAAQAPGLADRLRRERGPDAEVVVDLWPVTGQAPEV